MNKHLHFDRIFCTLFRKNSFLSIENCFSNSYNKSIVITIKTDINEEVNKMKKALMFIIIAFMFVGVVGCGDVTLPISTTNQTTTTGFNSPVFSGVINKNILVEIGRASCRERV